MDTKQNISHFKSKKQCHGAYFLMHTLWRFKLGVPWFTMDFSDRKIIYLNNLK